MKKLIAIVVIWAFMGVIVVKAEDMMRNIALKTERMLQAPLSAKPNFHIYDPFVETAPILAKAKESGSVSMEKILPNPPLRVSAVLNDRAFVNGRWVKKGDKIGEFKVISISQKRVVLYSGKKRIIVPLKKRSIIKMQPANNQRIGR